MTDNSFRLSFEFFPPKTDIGKEKLIHTRNAFDEFSPDFYSVTYGAGGSTRDNTKELVKQFHRDGFVSAPHLSFGGDGEDEIKALLEEYKAVGINRLVALRGDIPSGMGGASQMVYANQLVAFIRKHFGDYFYIEVAAYPEIHADSIDYQSAIQ